MPLSFNAQVLVDSEINELWLAFKAGHVSAGPDAMYVNKEDFKTFLALLHPVLSHYYNEEKLK